MNESRDGKVRYFWVDEDGKRTSPIHSTLGTALNHINNFRANIERLDKRIEKLQDKGAHKYELEGKLSAREKMMISGKPPVKLRRLVTTHTVEDPTEVEAELVKELYLTEFGDSE